MQVRMPTFVLTEADRRAIRWTKDGRKTACTREEAKAWIQAVQDRALADLRYRWGGPQVSEAVANGADPDGRATLDNPADGAAPSGEEIQAAEEQLQDA